MVLVALGPLLGPRSRSARLVVGLVAERPLDHPGGVVEAAQHPGDVAPRRVGQLPLGERLGRLALEVDDLPAVRRCAGSGRGAGRRGPAGRRGRRAAATSSKAAPEPVGVLLQLRVRRQRGRRGGRSSSAASSAAARGRPGLGREVLAQRRRAPRAAPRRAGSTRRRSRRRTRAACTSGSANRLRTLARARSQPSVAVRRNCWSIASCERLARRGRPRASRRARRRARTRPGSAPRGPRCRG